MAVVKLGAMFSAISGKVGGQVFVNNPKYQAIRTNTYHNKVANLKQSIVRFRTSTLANQWQKVTPANLLLWEAQSTNYEYVNNVGDTVKRNAYGTFMYSNMMRNLIGLSYVYTPETYQMPAAFTPSFIKYSETYFEVSAGDSVATNNYMVYGQILNADSSRTYKSKMKYLGFLTHAEILTKPNVYSMYSDYYGYGPEKKLLAILLIPTDLKCGQQYLGQDILYA